MKKWNRKLLLEDGTQYYGYGFGSQEETITELVFNTAPVGYQEILSDPSYKIGRASCRERVSSPV